MAALLKVRDLIRWVTDAFHLNHDVISMRTLAQSVKLLNTSPVSKASNRIYFGVYMLGLSFKSGFRLFVV